jgi:hypothetical protein
MSLSGQLWVVVSNVITACVGLPTFKHHTAAYDTTARALAVAGGGSGRLVVIPS